MQKKNENFWGIFDNPKIDDAVSLDSVSIRQSRLNSSRSNKLERDDFILQAKEDARRNKDILTNLFSVKETEIIAWQLDALCSETDPEAFFPERGGSTKDAKRICALCSVKDDCLDFALKNNERTGIWGGLSERERREIQSKRKADLRRERELEAQKKQQEKYTPARKVAAAG